MQNTAESCRQQLQNDADLKRKLAEKHKDDTRMSSYFETMAEQMEMAIYIFNLYFPPENKTTDANTDQPQTQAV